MNASPTIAKVLLSVFLLNGVLCPCAALADEAPDTAAPGHHHTPAADIAMAHHDMPAEADCHGAAVPDDCAMTGGGDPDSAPAKLDRDRDSDDPSHGPGHASPPVPLLADLSRHRPPPGRAHPPNEDTPVSRRDRMLD